MRTGTFINYWIGEESIHLDTMPAYVNIVPLAFVTIDANYRLNFDFLCKMYPESTIQGWIKTVRTNGTKVLFSINDQKIAQVPEIDAFADNVADNVSKWGVDGVDIDYEPPQPSDKLLKVTEALRHVLGNVTDDEPLLTAPIYEPWNEFPEFLKAFADKLDFVTTMDYTPYPGLTKTKQLFEQYATTIGETGKVAIGVSCMDPTHGNFTPLDDVKKLCPWTPSKKGVMLYNFSYDVHSRTRYPDGTFTKTINEFLP